MVLLSRAAYGHLAPVGDEYGRSGVLDDEEIRHGVKYNKPYANCQSQSCDIIETGVTKLL
jgi:hypothetical protein